MSKLRAVTSSLLLAVSAFIVKSASAQPGGPNPTAPRITANPTQAANIQIQPGSLGFAIPTFADILTFLIRFFFVMAGLAALIMLLWGALAWVTSGGDEDGIQKARDKIIAAIVGVVLIVVALAIIWTLEVIVFDSRLCLGLTCPVSIPTLLY